MTQGHVTAEARARSFLDGWRAEEIFKAHRNASRRRQALALQAGSAGVHAGQRSLPSGPAAPDTRVLVLGLVLLVPSAIGLGIAIGGWVGICALRVGWGIVTRRGTK